MQKCQISIFILAPQRWPPPSGSPLGEALAPQGDLGTKNVLRQKVFRI
jgi:hypothetical protein